MRSSVPGLAFLLAALIQSINPTGASQQGARSLGPDERLEQRLAPGEIHAYQVTLAADDFVHVVVRQRGISIAAALMGPDGEKLFEADTPLGARGAAWLTHISVTGGTYRIEVRATEKGAAPGSYEIEVEERRRMRPEDERRLVAQKAYLSARQLQSQKKKDAYLQAAEKFKEALGWFRAAGRRAEETATLCSLGDTYVAMSDYQRGLEYYEQSLAIYQRTGERAEVGAALHNIGNVNYRWRHYEKAIEYYERALAVRREVGDRGGEGRTLNGLGGAHSSLYRYEEAIKYYEQALAISRDVMDRAGEGIALSNLGGACNDLGRYEKAIEYYEQALAVRREFEDRRGEGLVLNSIGKVYHDLGQYQQAIEYYGQALVVRRKAEDRDGEGITLNNLGIAYRRLGRYGEAVEYFTQALAVRREVGNRIGEGVTLINLGSLYYNLGQYERAVGHYEQALAVVREIQDRRREGNVLNSLGTAYHALGQSERGLEQFEQALAVRREVNDRAGEGITLNNMGAHYHSLGQREKAVDYYERALAISRDLKARGDEGMVLNNLGLIYYDLGQYERAVGYHEQALAIAREIRDRAGEGEAFTALMPVWKARNNLNLAIFFGKQAVNTYQQMRSDLRGLERESQQSFLKSKEETYRDLADLLIAQGRLPEAQQVLGLLKEEEYFEFISRDGKEGVSLNRRADLTPVEAAALRRFNEIADQVAAIGTRAGELRALRDRTPQQAEELAKLETDLTAANRTFTVMLREITREFRRSSASQGKVKDLEESRALRSDLREWGEGVVMLSTLLGENRYHVILTTPAVQVARRSEIKAAELNRLILNFREAVQNPRLDPRPLGLELYNLLLKPVEKDLSQARAKTLVWSLDGALRYLPIAALYDGTQYVAERYSNVAITLASRTRLAHRGDVEWRGLGLGVSKPWPGFPPLTSAPEELREIIRDEKFGEQRGLIAGRVLLDDKFTEKAMLQELRQGYPLVHIASHFVFKPANEAASYLLLGDGSKLTMESLRHSADQQFAGVELLTLSACDTAAGGAGSDGREVEGFAMLSQGQGAKAVLATLWAVADPSTSGFMREFYRRRLSESRMAKAEALRQAQLTLLGTSELARGNEFKRGARKLSGQPLFPATQSAPYAHPYFWAPFILIGNWK